MMDWDALRKLFRRFSDFSEEEVCDRCVEFILRVAREHMTDLFDFISEKNKEEILNIDPSSKIFLLESERKILHYIVTFSYGPMFDPPEEQMDFLEEQMILVIDCFSDFGISEELLNKYFFESFKNEQHK